MSRLFLLSFIFSIFNDVFLPAKGCMGLCVENMQRLQNEANPLEVVEMFVSVFCFLKDSGDVTQVLLDDFRTSQGYVFLTEFLLK